jgi:hypothetical protein
MNPKTKDKIIDAICRGDILYIRDTGIRVQVDYFGTDAFVFAETRDKRFNCHIEFIDTPTAKCLRLCEKFDVKKNSHTNKMELNGLININKLSLKPYESKAGKLLYGK